MASVKISELNPLEKAEKEDLLVIVDTSESETKKIAIENLNIGSTDVVISETQPEGEDWKIWIDSNNDEAKYNKDGEIDRFKVGDTLPVGTEVDYDGEIIPAGWEEVSGPNEYSEQETVIGTFLGKPLYRKVVRFRTDTADMNKFIPVDPAQTLIDYFEIENCLVGGSRPYTYFIDATNNRVGIDFVITVSKLQYRLILSSLNNTDMILVYKYTKVTD